MGHTHSHDHSHHHVHGHDCSHGVSDGRRLLIAFLIISGFMVVEIFGGIISGSLALLADAGHMAADSGALLLALVAKWLADKETDADNYPFGLQRAQVLAGLLNGLLLLVLVGWLCYEAFVRIQNPSEILTGYMLVVAVIGLGANLVAFWVLHRGNMNDLNMRGAMLHVMTDIFGSVAAILSAIVIFFTSWYAIDAVLTILVSILIVYSALPLVGQALRVLLQGAPQNFNSEELTNKLLDGVEGISDVHEVQVWMLTPEEPRLAMHLRVQTPEVAQDVLKKVKRILATDYGIEHSTIQIECIDCPDHSIFHHDEEDDAYAQAALKGLKPQKRPIKSEASVI